MDPTVELELISRLKKLYGRMSLDQIRKRLGVSKPVFLYLLGKSGLPLKQSRVQTITVVHWEPTKEGGSAPVLKVSRAIVRKLGLRDGTKVQWTVEKGKIVGIPLTRKESD